MQTRSIFWFRRDLRLHDNAGLYHALRENEQVLPIFIFDIGILNKLENKYDRRVHFIHQALERMQRELAPYGSSLQVFYGSPEHVFEQLIAEGLKNVYANHDYEPSAIARDKMIKDLLSKHNVEFRSFKDQCIFEKQEVVKEDDSPYTVFTPYSRQWKKALDPYFYRAYQNKVYFNRFIKSESYRIPSLESMGFKKTSIVLPEKIKLDQQLIGEYGKYRDYPALEGTTHLSIHLRFGTVSIRHLVAKAVNWSEAWLNELIWRDFFMMTLFHFPYVTGHSFKKEYEHIPWRNNEVEFEKWCNGQTGFPLVDAGMRELNATGFMHNRARMITSSFLVKDLLIDWRWGEAYFAQKLDDFDLSANNGNWQWAAGCGCDAAPYFRVFNPAEQQKKFDPDFTYIKKWVPEFGTENYPAPMVDHAEARLRALSVYKKALNERR